MRRRSFPPLRTEVSELALGTWGLSGDGYGPISDAEADAVIDRAIQLGITLFDTADAYGNGEMERRLGRRLAKHPDRLIATRIGTDRSGDTPRKRFEPEYLREAFDKSRERIGRERIDVCLLHNPSLATLDRREATELLKELKDSKRIGAWGVSAGNRDTALAAIEAGADVISLTYNIFYSGDLHAVAAEVAMRGVAVLGHSVLAYGLLTGHWGATRTFEEGDHRKDRWTTPVLKKRVKQLEVVRQMVGGDVLTPRAAALRYVLANSLITSAVIGPRSTAQLDQLVREAGLGPPYLPDKVMSELPSRLLGAGITT